MRTLSTACKKAFHITVVVVSILWDAFGSYLRGRTLAELVGEPKLALAFGLIASVAKAVAAYRKRC